MEPTKEQIQWFWEQCGLKLKLLWGSYDYETGIFEPHEYERQHFDIEQKWCFQDSGQAPNGTTFAWWAEMLLIDLNNLFKYAVPKALTLVDTRAFDRKAFFELWLRSWTDSSDDPALALFWAIYKAFEG